jgi:UDP-N-acetylmuramoyl-tripeptide--D-alanyl-D-alanine ligase
MISLTVSEIAADAGGQLIQGDATTLVTGVSTDSRKIAQGCLFVALVGENFDGHGFCQLAASGGAAALLVSKIPSELASEVPVILVEDTLLALQRLAAAHRLRWGGIVVGLTGSNGKTSTKDLTKAILSVSRQTTATLGNLNNHIGLPLTCLAVRPEHEVGIFEMGMNHPGEIAPLAAIAQPNVAIITNVGTAHIEHMGSQEGIALEKGMLVEALGPDGMAILNADDVFSPGIRARHTGPTLTAGFAEAADIRITNYTATPLGSEFTLTFPDQQNCQVRLALPGKHMVGNAALAAAAAWHLGLRAEQIQTGLEQAQLNKGRLQLRQVLGITILDDSYNANPDSMLAGLETLRGMDCPGRRIAVLGRMGELGAHSQEGHEKVGRAAAAPGISLLCVVGEDDSRMLASAALKAGQTVHHFTDHARCAAFLKALPLTPQDLVFVKGSRTAAMERVIEHLS